jgi:hypothetical protein
VIASEAIVVAEIACTADGGCISCSWGLIEDLMINFPEHAALFKQVFLKERNVTEEELDKWMLV